MKFSRGVEAYKDGELAMSFATTSEAADWLREHGRPKATRGRVYDAACGIRKSAYGFTWRLTGPEKRAYGSAKTDDKRLYKIWSRMKARVADPNDDSYQFEGGCGIEVCDGWQSYDGFKDWALASGYEEGRILARADLEKDYCPENCSWVDPLLGRGHALPHQRVPLVRRDERGVVTRYGSLTEAAIALVSEGRGHYLGDIFKTAGNIQSAAKGKSSIAYGSSWWYADDPDAPKPGKTVAERF